MSRKPAWATVAAVGMLVMAACTVDTRDGADPRPPAGPGAAATGRDQARVASALDDMLDPSFPEPLIDPGLVLPGGPAPDEIPPIDSPRFETAETVDWLGDDEAVLSLTVGDETRAYPLQVMIWHEIVNDVVGGTEVAVTYCPLCNSGVAFERRSAGRLLSFGTSGRLYDGNLVMYDRQTESLWPQLTGQASIGVLTGTQLTAIPMGPLAWEEFRAAHPEALVLSRDTGFDRPYGRNPYAGYDDPDSSAPFTTTNPTDRRLPAKARVVGIDIGDDPVAVARDRLATDHVLELSVGGADLVIFHQPGQASALDTGTLADGAAIGTVAVFHRRVDGRTLAFAARDGRLVDSRTGTRWDVLGRAVAGPLRGSHLEPVRFLDTFWFAWVAFNPDTRLAG